ncbi:MAG TPA: FAD-linked oxidase C-terminal domain-containing protein [Acidimicrobiales bacterium]|nr:FAD-linked oxidase C-terminal domain-containing protein [Acidimicrobiales bacterium]
MDNLDWRDELSDIFHRDVTFQGAHSLDDLHDESLHQRVRDPLAVVRPRTTTQVQAVARWATRHRVPLTLRGSGTGLSGGAVPVDDGVVVAFDRMNEIIRVDGDDHVCVVQPGVTLRELNDQLADTGLHYPVYPGELSGSLGGNVATNAGGMRAVRHGVTRHHVLGLELVLMNGTIVRTGGAVMKSSSGYDLTQLMIGSEGTLAMVTEVTLRLSPRLEHSATLLVPFATLSDVTRVVPRLIALGIEPSILEYIDFLTWASITNGTDLALGVPTAVNDAALAFLVVVLETRTKDQLDADLAAAAQLLATAQALDVYVLEGAAANRLVSARERVFWTAKASGANEIIDVVVPRSAVPVFLEQINVLASGYGALVAGCGHVGDGNVHLSVFQPDDEVRAALLLELFRAGVSLGGAISGEHGLGMDKQGPYLALSDPALIELQRQIKKVFDPEGLLNPRRHLDATP